MAAEKSVFEKNLETFGTESFHCGWRTLEVHSILGDSVYKDHSDNADKAKQAVLDAYNALVKENEELRKDK